MWVPFYVLRSERKEEEKGGKGWVRFLELQLHTSPFLQLSDSLACLVTRKSCRFLQAKFRAYPPCLLLSAWYPSLVVTLAEGRRSFGFCDSGVPRDRSGPWSLLCWCHEVCICCSCCSVLEWVHSKTLWGALGAGAASAAFGFSVVSR